MAQTVNSPASISTVTDAAPVQQRDMLIDVVRGIAIALVVLGHTNLGLLHRGWWGSSHVGIRLNDAIYSFHMPAFFFVSGVFLRPGVDKRGVKHYTLEKLRTIIYPYILWAFIFATAPVFFARFTSQVTPSWKTFLFHLVTGNTSWFLPTLFLLLMIGMLTRRIPTPLLFVLSLVIWKISPYQPQVGFLERGVRSIPFLIAGMWLGRSFTQMRRVPFAVAAILAIVFAVVIVVATGGRYSETSFRYLALGFLGTLMLLLVARCLGQSDTARTLSWIGAASFGIFLMSTFPQGAGREILTRIFHTKAPLPQLIFPTLLAVLIPAWLYHYRVRLHIQWMFRSPF